MKVTVFGKNFKDIDSSLLHATGVLKKAKNPYDEKAIEFIYQGEVIGLVGVSNNTVANGCQTGHNLYEKMSSEQVECKIVDYTTIHFKNGRSTRAIIVEVNFKKAKKVSGGGDRMEFKVKVKGSIRQNPGKPQVIELLKNGDKPKISLEANSDGEIIVKIGEIRAGVVDENSLTKEAIQAIEILKVVQGTATELSGTSYEVEFAISKVDIKDAQKGVNTIDIRQKAIDEGLIDEGILKEIEIYLTDNGLSRRQISEVIKSFKKYDGEAKERIPAKPKTLFKDTFGAVKKSVIYINKHKHLRFVGDKGVGKNLLVTTLAWIFQRPLYELSLNSQFDKLDLLGSKTFEQEVSEDGKEVTKIAFDKEVFIRAMEEGAFINLDEVNTADPSVLVQLHSVVDDRGSIQVPGYGKVIAEENFGIILTMNSDYIGTNPLNEATRDRFTPIIFPQNKSIESILREKVPTASIENVKLANKVYSSIVRMVEDNELSSDCITVRGFIDALEVAEDLGLSEALIDNVANRIDDIDYRNDIKNIIDDIVG